MQVFHQRTGVIFQKCYVANSATAEEQGAAFLPLKEKLSDLLTSVIKDVISNSG